MTATAASLLRLEVFAGVFLLLAFFELVWPLRRDQSRTRRWPANIGLSLLNTAVLRIIVFMLPAAALATVAQLFSGSGVLSWLGATGVLQQVAGFVILDLAVYAQHRLFHLVPFFWRFHQVHHADLTLDVSSAVRFHTVEILLSQAWKIVVVVAAGVPPEAAFAFEVVLNASSMFSHANVALPPAAERFARLFVVTPDMHRIHHSVLGFEMNSNFGFNFSVWDRMFGSYVAQPKVPAAVMEMGLPDHRGRSTSSIPWLLAMPLREGSSS